jgi:hypothetical protein
MQPCGQHCPCAARQGAKKRFVLHVEAWIFLFLNFFLHMLLYDVILNMTTNIKH